MIKKTRPNNKVISLMQEIKKYKLASTLDFDEQERLNEKWKACCCEMVEYLQILVNDGQDRKVNLKDLCLMLKFDVGMISSSYDEEDDCFK